MKTASSTSEQQGEALELQEAGLGLASDQTDREGQPLPKGLYKVHIIRPGVGRGRGRHLYQPEMLSENAHKFAGWKMFLNHLSPEARKAAGGLPRPFEHLGGSIKESWWDPSVPADATSGHGQGAVVGLAKPVGLAKRILEDDPEIAELSISAHATGVRDVRHGGQRVKLVEGIHDQGSVDWVTQAGAGGKVVGLAEALIEEGQFDTLGPGDLLEWLSDDDLTRFVREQRPELAEALGLEGEGEGEIEEVELDENLGENVSTTQQAADPGGQPSAEGGDDMGKITPDELREALRDPDTSEVLKGIIAEQTAEALAEQAADFDQRSELTRAEARADADRAIQLTRLERRARDLIDESALPDGWKVQLREQYQLDESGFPTPQLDVVDEVDGASGEVTKRASEVLAESVAADVERLGAMYREVAPPTRVRGQGPSRSAAQRADAGLDEGADPDAAGGEGAADGERERVEESDQDKPYWREYLEEARIDPDKAFRRPGARRAA